MRDFRNRASFEYTGFAMSDMGVRRDKAAFSSG
jgi:hypothetical protein